MLAILRPCCRPTCRNFGRRCTCWIIGSVFDLALCLRCAGNSASLLPAYLPELRTLCARVGSSAVCLTWHCVCAVLAILRPCCRPTCRNFGRRCTCWIIGSVFDLALCLPLCWQFCVLVAGLLAGTSDAGARVGSSAVCLTWHCVLRRAGNSASLLPAYLPELRTPGARVGSSAVCLTWHCVCAVLAILRPCCRPTCRNFGRRCTCWIIGSVFDLALCLRCAGNSASLFAGYSCCQPTCQRLLLS